VHLYSDAESDTHLKAANSVGLCQPENSPLPTVEIDLTALALYIEANMTARYTNELPGSVSLGIHAIPLICFQDYDTNVCSYYGLLGVSQAGRRLCFTHPISTRPLGYTASSAGHVFVYTPVNDLARR